MTSFLRQSVVYARKSVTCYFLRGFSYQTEIAHIQPVNFKYGDGAISRFCYNDSMQTPCVPNVWTARVVLDMVHVLSSFTFQAVQ